MARNKRAEYKTRSRIATISTHRFLEATILAKRNTKIMKTIVIGTPQTALSMPPVKKTTIEIVAATPASAKAYLSAGT